MKLTLLSAFALALIFVTAPSPSLASTIGKVQSNNIGLVGYWNFDGPSMNWRTNTTADASGQGNTGTLVSMSTSTSPVAGKIGQALKFDGVNDIVNITDQDPLDFATSDFTLSAWIKTRITSTSGAYRIIAKRSGSVGYEMYIEGAQTTLSGFIGDADSFTAGALGTTNLRDTKWHHVVVVFNRSGNATGYVDGTVQSTPKSITGENTSIATTHTLQIGRGDFGNLFDGSIDDVRVYNRALSATQVALLYAVGQANVAHSNTVTLATGLVGYWTFDGGATNWLTNTTADSSGQGNTGTLVSMSTSTSPVAGKIGQALNFNGSTAYVDTANFANNLPNFAVSAWFQAPAASTGNGNTIVAKMSGNISAGIGWMLLYRQNKVQAYIQTDNLNWVGQTTTGTYKNTRWHHAVMVVTGGNTLTLYVDGSTSGTTPTNGGTVGSYSNSSNVRIGNNYNSELFNGFIDDVRIYNRALSAQEVKQLYALGQANVAHSNTGTNAPLSNGLVGYWNFDGPSMNWRTNTVADASGSGNTGTLVSMSTTTSPVAGKIGQALKFDGVNDAITVANEPFWDGSPANHTYAAWVYIIGDCGTSGGNICNGIATKKRGGAAGYAFSINATDHVLFNVNSSATASTDAIGRNAWHHVVAVLDATTRYYYIDGKPSGSAAFTAGIDNNTSLILGAGSSVTTVPDENFFNGKIDDVRIYNRALSAQEIKQLYSMGR